MNRAEFDALRQLAGKTIAVPITLSASRNHEKSMVALDIPVENSMGVELILDVTFKPEVPALTFNFSVKGVGPICRVDINGTIHGNAGRTHKHELQNETDPRNNLPFALARAELMAMPANNAWTWVCQQANINHTSTFRGLP